jgi:outer membrane protein with beta-barrel domain
MKTFFALILIIAISMNLQAQRTDAYLGIKAGVNVASLNVEDGQDLNSIVSAHLGALVHIHVSPHFAIQPELFLSGQGGENGDDKVKLAYLNLPVLFQYMAGDGFRLHTGPQLGVLLKAKEKIGDAEYTVTNSFDNIDFGWEFGASYQFPGSGVGLDARYTLGLTDVTESSNSNAQNRVFAFGLFYQFMNNNLGRRK